MQGAGGQGAKKSFTHKHCMPHSTDVFKSDLVGVKRTESRIVAARGRRRGKGELLLSGESFSYTR